MDWRDDVEQELIRADAAARSAQAGRVRTSARRAVGIALTELQRKFPEKNYGRDFITQLRGIAGDHSVREEVRLAADRLQARLSTSFESPSKNPIEDARIIISFVLERLA